jgi:D-serine dehydratase
MSKQSILYAPTFRASTVTITAGGSAFFDRIVALLSDWTELDLPAQLVLRSGCYITHDQGKYHLQSPLDGRRSTDEDLRLENALEGWATVLSRPEPGLAILGTGKRDLPYDAGLPTPQALHPIGSSSRVVIKDQATIFKMMDQHSFMTVNPDLPMQPGDIVTLGMSHPCTAFDKLRFVPIIGDDYVVVDGVLTFF